jgi:hypothetical protein
LLEWDDKSEANMMFRTVVLAACLAVICGPSARAGGDDYDAMSEGGEGPVYFGFVRDNRGLQVPDAQVVLRPKSGDPVTIKANAVGLYRSHISKDVIPDDVEISCEKPGYAQTKVFRRTPPGSKDRFIETECFLQRL